MTPLAPTVIPTDPPPAPVTLAEAAHAPEKLAGRKNLLQLVQLRSLAVAGQFVTIAGATLVLDLDLPLREMLLVLAALSLFNLASWLRCHINRAVGDHELLAGLLVDAAALSAQLYYSGGIANPFVFLFLLQVAVAAVLLKPWHAWTMVVVTGLCIVALTRWHQPLAMPGLEAAALSVHYIGGLLLCFLMLAALLVVFIGRIEGNLRQRDARLAALRQRAAEEEHIVRMGLLASGAAHELGTPLATLSVILGDWARMAPFAADPELCEEIEEMQRQVQRCKGIVTGILTSAGETRGEAPALTTLHAFLDALVAQWQSSRGVTALHYQRDDLPDLPIVSDTALKQMIDNVLDNALEAAPGAPLRLAALAEREELVLSVRDRGPGFAPEVLARLGKPYQSTKGQPGRGLGLFLCFNVARNLGGHITARNREGGGAEVTIRLPLAALARSPDDDR